MSLPSFQSRFNLDTSTGTALAALKANIVSTFQGGCFFGVLLCYFLVEKLGRRLVLMMCGAVFDLGAILQLVSGGSLAYIDAGRVLTDYSRHAVDHLHVLPAESPRWLLNAGRTEQARKVLQRLRQLPADDSYLNWEINSVLQQIEEENALGATKDFLARLQEVVLPTKRSRLLLGIALVFIQNMSGINALNYYSPSIFQSIGFTGTRFGLLATGIFGIVKASATGFYMIWGVDALGQLPSRRHP
ncbi:hypothetical protein EDB81DRAFT_760862 [Dactylonectria macrodidyma]|uniref:Major facilitator superfamily (MFS) profile domain-containing protein n=1 Tax=Dactylonectria macrodidyma TaxID=307937 RepID=A0A9P9IZU8_9HYPO|nr:hypothetical protein EDB81DRAFT_760862 [Dactylonectria macrodidyma]